MLARTPLLFALALLGLACAPAPVPPAENTEPSFPDLSGPYLGQTPPGAEPEIFAPGIVSTPLSDRDLVVAPDGNEIYFAQTVGPTLDVSAIFVTRQVDGAWTPPEAVPFASSAEYLEIEPALSADGRKLFYVSNRPAGGDGPPMAAPDIWAVERDADGGAWGTPRNLGAPVNSDGDEFFPSVTRDGTLYFTREGPEVEDGIFRARPLLGDSSGDSGGDSGGDGGYEEPERLPVDTGRGRYNAYVDPDETFLLFSAHGTEDSRGGPDYYIVFNNGDGTWTEAVSLGDKVNTKSQLEYSASVSPDGRYLFFMTSRPSEAAGALTRERLLELQAGPGNGLSDVYWVDASFLAGLRR